MRSLYLLIAVAIASQASMAQTYSYDSSTGNSYQTVRVGDTTTTYGYNANTGSTWQQTNQGDNTYYGTNKNGEYYYGNQKTGTCVGACKK